MLALDRYFAPDRRAAVWAGIVAMISVSLWLIGEAWYSPRLVAAEQARLRQEVIEVTNEFAAALQRDLAVLGALTSHVESLSADHLASDATFAQNIESALPRYHSASIEVRTISVAPGGVLRFIYPLAGNEVVLNHDLLNDQRPGVRESVIGAIQSRSMVLREVRTLASGSSALVARQPIFQNGAFWGFTTMVLDVDALLRAAGVDRISLTNDIALRSATGQVFLGSPELLDAPDAISRIIYLPDGQWLMAAAPRGGWSAFLNENLHDARVGAACVGLLFIALVYLVVRRHSWLEREVGQRTKMLTQSHARFRDFAEATSDWFWEQGPDLRFTYVSEGGGLNAARRAQEAIGKTRREVVAQGATEEQWAAHEADLAARRPFRDFRVQRSDEHGQIRHVSVSGVPLFDAAGAFLGYRGTGADITARVEAERTADEARRRLVESIESFTDGFVLWDAQDRLVMCNSMFRQMFDSPEWLVPGLTFAEYCRRITAMNRLVETGEGGIEGWIARRMQSHISPSGPIEVPLAGDRCMVIHESRTAAGDTVGLYTDTTEIFRTRSELRAANERYELASLQAGIWDWDLVERQVHYSPRFIELLGYEADEFSSIVCDSIMSLLHPDDVADYVAAIDDHMSNPAKPYRSEHRFLTKDRGYRWFLARGQSRSGADGKPVRMAGLVTDIDDRRRMQEELRFAKEAAESASRVKSAFLASMSHELRTPLNAVIGFSEIMATEVLGPIGSPKYIDYAKDILASGQHLLAVINDVLDLSKVEAGHLELREDVLDLAAEIVGAMRLVDMRARNAGVTLAFEEPDDMPVFQGDALRIKQVMLNLLTNAVKFTSEGGAITVTMQRAPDTGDLIVTVADTGIGMTKEEVAIALEPFRQIDNVHTRSQEGTGLGLPLAKAFVEQHGGRLEIESERGVGTKVSMILPASRLIATDAPEIVAAA